MSTKIFVSQIDSTNPDGNSGNLGSYLVLGSQGAFWTTGDVPPVGYTGSIGEIGVPGISGFNGSAGEQGVIGDPGFEGYAGSIGDQGSVGHQGSVGFEGSIGATGYLGTQGYYGSAGFSGSVGFNGSFGITGYQGTTGDKGSVGFTGSTGDPYVPQLNFNQLLDLSPNTYTGRANYVVTVNTAANGITLVNPNNFVMSTMSDRSLSWSNVVIDFDGTYSKVYNANLINATVSYSTENIYSNTSVTNSVTLPTSSGSIRNVARLTLSPSSGSTVAVTLPTTGIPSNKHFTLTIYLKQDATGSRTVDWSTNTIKWPLAEGVPLTGPTLSTTANYVDVVTFTTLDGGTSWYGFLSAKGFSS